MRKYKLSDTTKKVYFLMVDETDHVTPETLLTVSVSISKNGATFAPAAGSVDELESGIYAFTYAAGDIDTLGPILLRATATGADPSIIEGLVVAYDPYSASNLGLSNLDAAISTRSDFDNATETVNLSAAYDPAKTAAQAGDAMTLVDNAITAAKIAASALNDKGNWNTTTPPTTAQIKTALEAVGSYLDLIKAKTDNVATEAALTALRGADNDTLKTLSDQVDGVTGGTINNITNESTTITRC